MSDPVVEEFAGLCADRFLGLGDAVRSVLTLLERQLAGRVIFGELNYDTDEYRVLDARGEGVESLSAGARLPLRESFCVHMANGRTPALIGRVARQPIYKTLELYKSAKVQSYVAAPVDLGDGTRVASVCAMSTERDRYGERDLALLTISARLIAYEWERVTREGELRRLAQQQRTLSGDPLTGLPLRDAFLEQLDRECHLAQRGITESYVVALKPRGVEEARSSSGEAVADLLLRSTSEVISDNVRRSDIAGRVGADVFGVILVGCKGVEGADAFCSRLVGAFERKLSERPEKLELIAGIERLNGESAEAALERAEDAVRVEPATSGAAG